MYIQKQKKHIFVQFIQFSNCLYGSNMTSLKKQILTFSFFLYLKKNKSFSFHDCHSMDEQKKNKKKRTKRV